MAVNPAEDIVNVWLQDNLGYFTRQNVVVPKGERFVNERAIHGGKGKEIDILGINTSGDKVWVEVTVSPNPYLALKSERVEEALKKVTDKFCEEKEVKVREIFGGNKFRKIFVYSSRILLGEEPLFLEKVKELGIEAMNFESIFAETIENLRHYSVEPTRIHLYYTKKFLLKK